MKSELVTALMSAGMPFEPTERPDQHRVVIVASRGAIPPPVSLPGDFVWNRGFNLLVLDKGGSPSHYCKCRPLDDHLLPHETRVRQVLSHDPRLSSLVPYACQTETRRFRLQASGYISGTPLNTMLRTLRPAELLSTLSQVLKAAEKVSRVAADLLPDLFHNDRPADLARDVDPALAYLGRRGVASVIITTLRNTLLAAGALPRRLQHGDLWPGNVVVTKRRWWILDFELFGQIQVPLYDACHLLRTSSDIVATPPSNDVWVNRLVQRNPLGSLSRQLLRDAAASDGLSPEQALGAMVYYVVDFATRIHRRAVPAAFSRPFLSELGHLAHALEAEQVSPVMFTSST